MMKKQDKKAPDFILFYTVLILLGIGLVMVFSSSYIISLEARGDPYFYLRRQTFWILLGLGGMFVLSNFDYWKWKKLTPVLLLLNFILLVAVFIPGIGVEVHGARRWIGFGGFGVQPAEFTKLVMVIFSAAFLSRRGIKMKNFWSSSFIPLAFLGVSFLLILLQPDLGTALAIAMIVMVIIFAAGIPWKHLFYLLSVSLLVAIYLMFNEEYRMERLLSFLDPWKDPLDTGYHIIQSLYALGSGGLLGVGLGRSRQKLYYLPEPQNDFIFAIIGEELGFVGTATVVILFFILLWRGFKIAFMAPDVFGSLLAAGITAMIGLQVFINIGVVTGSMPITGINLPLISAGGSSIFFTLCGIGILLNISKYV